jgi:hypothetical protein
MTARAAALPRAPIYGIGRYQAGTEQFDFEVGWPEFARDTAWAQSQLTRAGLSAGDAVLITALSCEGPWFGPVLRAFKALGITYLPAEVYAFDAGRSAAQLQQFELKAVIGLGAETVDGWIDKELSPQELLNGVDIVWARPAALGKLADISARVAPVFTIGPALALGIPGDPGTEVNAAEWRIDDQGGLLNVSNTAERTAAFDRAPTGLRGTVTEVGGRQLVTLVE